MTATETIAMTKSNDNNSDKELTKCNDNYGDSDTECIVDGHDNEVQIITRRFVEH